MIRGATIHARSTCQFQRVACYGTKGRIVVYRPDIRPAPFKRHHGLCRAIFKTEINKKLVADAAFIHRLLQGAGGMWRTLRGLLCSCHLTQQIL